MTPNPNVSLRVDRDTIVDMIVAGVNDTVTIDAHPGVTYHIYVDGTGGYDYSEEPDQQ